MPIALVTGPANSGKAHVLLEATRAHAARGHGPLLIVPTEADQARYRRELAEGGLALGVRVERFAGLQAEVLECAGDTRPTLGPLAREHVLARMADARPGMARELAALIADLQAQRVTPARLRGALRVWKAEGKRGWETPEAVSDRGEENERERWEGEGAEKRSKGGGGKGGGEKGGGGKGESGKGEGRDGGSPLEELCTAFERYQRTLAKMRRADRELRVADALDRLRRRPATWGAVPVLLYGFDDFTEQQIDTILTLGGVVGAPVTVSLAYEPGRVAFAGRAATFQRLAPLAESHTALRARADYYEPHARQALHHLERSLLSDDPRRVEPGEAVRLLEGVGPRAELELVAGEVRALLDADVPAEEIAIVHRSPESIAGLLGEVLEDHTIPYAQRRRALFAHSAIGRALLGLLRCAVDAGPDAQTTGGHPGGRSLAGAAWRAYPEGTRQAARQVGELADLLAWLGAPGVLERPELLDRLELLARKRGIKDSASARALWEADNWPLDRLDRVRAAATAGTRALIDALLDELKRLFCAPRTRAAAVLGEDELGEARALAAARRTLEELRELARAAPELAPSAGELIGLLERLELNVGEHLEPGRVVVVAPLSLRARRVRMVFACGLQEGIFPTTGTPQPLLQERHRRELARASGLVLRGEPDALAGERYLLYALVSRPRERLTLSWHVADEDGAPLARSLFVEDVCDLFTPALSERTLRRVGPDGTGLAADSAGGPGRTFGDGAPPREELTSAEAPGSTRAGALPSSARQIQPLNSERVLGELRERALWSASSLETWTSCPVKWFVERLLRADDIDPDPEALARGSLAHAALKQTLERLRERTASARLTPASAGLARRLLRETLIELEPEYPLSVAPERSPGARRRLQVDLERYVQYAAEQASPLEPTYLELEFGFARETRELGDGEAAGPGADPPSLEPPERAPGLRAPAPGERAPALPPFDLGEGIQLRGRIDRVDLGSAGEAVVYDYKGRFAPPGVRWLGEGALQLALYMRAVEALLGPTAVGGFYQPLAGRDIRARGVLDGDSPVELDCVRTDRLEHESLRELIDECLAASRTAAKQARAGALEPRPASCAYNGGCAYPTICRCER